MNHITSNGITGKRHGQRVTLLVSVVRDVSTLAMIGLFLLALHHFATPFKRGFHCDDETIRYPFKDSTVPSGFLHIVGILVNVLLIGTFEYLALRSRPTTTPTDQPGVVDSSAYALNVYARVVVFLFGAIASETITEIAKYSAGRLRPHFLAVCQPRMSATGANYSEYCESLKGQSMYAYITDYSCSGEQHRERDTRLSFMSGHSSYAAYTATFAVMYLQSAMSASLFGLAKPCSQALLVFCAFYTGLSRVSDYKHHWQDVLAGLTQGTAVAVVVSRFVWPHFYASYLAYRARRGGQRAATSGGDLSPSTGAHRSASDRHDDRIAGEELGQIY